MSAKARLLYAGSAFAAVLVLCLLSDPVGAAPNALTHAHDDIVATLFCALLAGGLCWGVTAYFGAGDRWPLLLAVLTLVAGLWLRYLNLAVATSDYTDFLTRWVAQFRQYGAESFRQDFSNYNMPYLYLLWLVAALPVYELYLIKFISLIFDALLVLAALRLSRRFAPSPLRRGLLVSLLMLAPTLWINSSLWGQCDVIYAFFVLMALVYVLEDRPVRSFIMAALGFAFKLQAIFFLPVYAVFWIAKKVRLWQFFVFPAVFMAGVLPAWLLGKPMGDILGVYVGQTTGYTRHLNFNSPSMYALIYDDGRFHDFLFVLGIVLAALLVLFLWITAWMRRAHIDDKALLLFSLAMVLGIPWFLPTMHDRYFYLADVLCLFLPLVFPRKWYFAPLCVFASYAGYHAYLYGRYLYYVGVVVPSLFLLLLLAETLVLVHLQTRPQKWNGEFLPLRREL